MALVSTPPATVRSWDIPIEYPTNLPLVTTWELQGSPDRTNWSHLQSWPGTAWDTQLQKEVPLPHNGPSVTVSNPPGVKVYFWRIRGVR